MVRSDDNWKQSQILKSQILATWSFSLLTLDNCLSVFTVVPIFWSGPFSCVSNVYPALHGFTKTDRLSIPILVRLSIFESSQLRNSRWKPQLVLFGFRINKTRVNKTSPARDRIKSVQAIWLGTLWQTGLLCDTNSADEIRRHSSVCFITSRIRLFVYLLVS